MGHKMPALNNTRKKQQAHKTCPVVGDAKPRPGLRPVDPAGGVFELPHTRGRALKVKTCLPGFTPCGCEEEHPPLHQRRPQSIPGPLFSPPFLFHRPLRHRQCKSKCNVFWYLGNPVTARGATPKASPAKAVPVEPPTKKVKTTERDLPQELIAVQKDKLEAALSLISNFHVLDIGLHEAYLGCGLLLEWTAHSDFPAESLTVDLVELITRCQARDVEATKAPKPKQRAILCGLLSFETATNLYTEAYLLCVQARRDISEGRSRNSWNFCRQQCGTCRASLFPRST